MDKIINILESVKPGIDFNKEQDLITDGILTSFDIVTIIAKLKEEFDIEITVKDIVPENFTSAKTIKDMVDRLED